MLLNCHCRADSIPSALTTLINGLPQPSPHGSTFDAVFSRIRLFFLTTTRTGILNASENAWKQIPHIVSQGAQKNFLSFSTFASDDWTRNSDQFNDDYFKRLVGKALLFHTTEKLVAEQPWYQGGYRANIVAYSVSKTFPHG
jgi:hypothetical protein